MVIHIPNQISLLSVIDIHKSYIVGKLPVNALRGVSTTFYNGDFVSITGPSGSGKSTLLHLIGGFDRPTQGNVLFQNQDISTFSDNKLADYRLNHIGFVFQSFNLIPSLSAFDNVLLPLIFAGKLTKKEQKIRVLELLELMRLKDRKNHYPGELSGGEQQRVSIARAIANNPTLILADEPTGDLDSKSGDLIINILSELNKDGKTVIIVTHDENIATNAKKRISILDGKIATFGE